MFRVWRSTRVEQCAKRIYDSATVSNGSNVICGTATPVTFCWRAPFNDNNNKSAQSNLGRGPRRGVVAHVRHKVPIDYNCASQIRPQKYPFPWTDPHTSLPASSLDPSDLRCQTAFGSDPPFFHNALDRQTDRQTDRPTDRPRESLTTIGRCATRTTRPNNNRTTLFIRRRNVATTRAPKPSYLLQIQPRNHTLENGM